MYVKAFVVNVNKCLKTFFLEQHINVSKIDEIIVVNKHGLVYIDFGRAGSLSLQLY